MAQTNHFNPRGTTRIVPMKVLVLGYPRTGTASMSEALEVLGYKDAHHMLRGLSNPLEVEMWREAVEAKFHGKGKPYGREEWDQLLGRYQSVSDISVLFWEDFLLAYPHAKVILTTRDPDAWWKSMQATIHTLVGRKQLALAEWLDPKDFGAILTFSRLVLSEIFACGPFRVTEDNAKGRFLAHYENVRQAVPSDKLLEYRVGEGWERLCEFLGKDIPQGVAFPKKNDSKLMREAIDSLIWRVYWQSVEKVLLPLATVTAVGVAVYAARF
ncbi:P-loop containing nucleoside triphosphate hydrolase protein [Mycena rebaudengoi]|nr:P-loop containing nucleoside triphosphate hydrolase protein [Mycena rebaudengoi]